MAVRVTVPPTESPLTSKCEVGSSACAGMTVRCLTLWTEEGNAVNAPGR